MLLSSLAAKCKQKTSITAKTQPILKKSREYFKGLRNKPILVIKVTVYI